jgi:hypothetical protein
VYLGRTVGAFKFLQEGYRPPEKKGTKKKGMKKPAMIAVGVVVAVVVGAVLFSVFG